MAGSHPEQGRPAASEHLERVWSAQPEAHAMARTRLPDGGRTNPQRRDDGELVNGIGPVGRPNRRYKDVCKRDLKACDTDTATWKAVARYLRKWRQIVKAGVQRSDQRRGELWQAKRESMRQGTVSAPPKPDQIHTCNNCNMACRSRIGLFTHMRRCN